MSNTYFTDLTLSKDVDSIQRPVVTLSGTITSKDWEFLPHQHCKAQLLYSVRGMLTCEVDGEVWLVPPQRAIWIPGKLQHSGRGTGRTECYCFFVESKTNPRLPNSCCTLTVNSLLHELMIKIAGFPALYPLGGSEERFIATFLDELAIAPMDSLHLPIPRDPRLRLLAELLINKPADKTTASDWAIRIGMSERSMSRLFLKEVGISFGRWYRQLHVIVALQRLVKGESVQRVALELGYENASGFITMFRKAVGKPPARYLAERAESKNCAIAPIVLESE